MRCRSARRSAGSRGIASSGRIDSTGWRSIWKGERNAPGHQRSGGSNMPSKKDVKPKGQATKAADKGKRRELVLARVFDAPRERVLEGMDGASGGQAMVGAEGLQRPFLQDRPPRRWHVPVLHALARGARLLGHRRLPRDRATEEISGHRQLRGREGPCCFRDRVRAQRRDAMGNAPDRNLRGTWREDEVDAPP